MKAIACLVAEMMSLAQPAWSDSAETPFLGSYGGGQMGYLWLDSGAGTSLPGGVAAGGIHLGLTQDWSGTIVGIELELDTQHRLFANDYEVVKAVARLKIRAGAARRGVFTYGVAGFAAVDTTLGAATGWTLGAGAEAPVGDRWRVGVEVLHDRFDGIGAGAIPLSLSSVNFRASFRF